MTPLPPSTRLPRRFEIAVLIATLLLAGYLRLVAPGVVEFKRDEANLSQLALDFARGRSFPLLGISSSVGIPNSPISAYILAIPYLLTSNPIVATQFVGALNVFAVLLTYLLTRRHYGAGAALLAALLYAVSPWGVIYSRKIWAQDLLPPFVLGTLLTGLIGFVEGKRWAQWLCVPLFVITAQIHYSALLLVFPVAYLIWVGRRCLTRTFFLSLIPIVLLSIPFVMGILRADLPTLDELRALTASTAERRSLGLTTRMLQYAAFTIAGTEIHSLAGPQAFQQYLASVPDAYPLFGLLAWGVLIAVLWLMVRVWKVPDSRRPVDLLLLLWLVLPVAVFSVTWTEPYPHYLIIVMPAAYIILAVGALDLWNALRSRFTLRRIVFVAGGAVLIVILILQIFLWITLVNFLETNHTPDGFGAPLQLLMPVRDYILSRQPSQVLARLDGQFVGMNDDATVWNFLLTDVPSVRFLDENTELLLSEPTLFLSRNCDSSANSEQFLLRTTEEGCYQVSQIPPDEMPVSDYTTISQDSRYSNGVNLVGYRWSSGGVPCLDLLWSISMPATQDFMFSVHFFDDSGQEIGNADALSWRGVYWRPGDTVIRRFCLSSEQTTRMDDITGVNIGMYTYDGINFHNVDVLDAAGTPIGQVVPIRFDS